MNEVEDQNENTDPSPIRTLKKGKLTKFSVDVPNPMTKVLVPYQALPNRQKNLLKLWNYKQR